MNKRADIAITILVIGVFAICTFAILSFYFPSTNIKDEFRCVELVSEAALVLEEIEFYEKVGAENPIDMIDFGLNEERTKLEMTFVEKPIPLIKKEKTICRVESSLP